MRGWAPGGRGPLAPLQEMRRQSHEAVRKSIDAMIAERKRSGVPLDDDTDWRAEGGRIGELTIAVKEQDSGRYRKALEEGLMATRGALAALGPYEPSPRLEGIQVRFRTVPRRVWWATVGRQQELAAREAVLDKKGFEEGASRGQLLADIEEARIDLVRHSLVELRGLEDDALFAVEGDATQCALALGTLVESGLLTPIALAARDFQGLDPEGRWLFGLAPPSTSETSSAHGAQRAIAQPRDATAERPLGTSEAAATRRTSVLDVDSFDTLGLPTHSPSGEQPMAARSASTAPS